MLKTIKLPLIQDLPDENLLYIISLVVYSSNDLIILEQVCRRFRKIAKDNTLWLEVAKREWEVFSSWDFEIELLLSPRDWVFKKKYEIQTWRDDLKILKQYTDLVGHPKDLLTTLTTVINDFGKLRIKDPEHSLISQFKLFKEFFTLIRNIFFVNCRPEFVHNIFARLDGLSDEIVNSLRYRKNVSYSSLLIDFSVLTLLAQFIYHIIPGPGDASEGRPRACVASPIIWEDKQRLVYILDMLTMSNAYCNLITCAQCRTKALEMTKDSKGVKCSRCMSAPGYFLALGKKNESCHDLHVYCKSCCNSLGRCSKCCTFIRLGHCLCLSK